MCSPTVCSHGSSPAVEASLLCLKNANQGSGAELKPGIDELITQCCYLPPTVQAQEVQALLCLPAEPSVQPGEGTEPSETSHDTVRSSDTLGLRRPCQPAHTRTKHHSGSNVSFSHDTEGGEDDQAQVKAATVSVKVHLMR